MKGDRRVLVFEPDLLFSSKIESLSGTLGLPVSTVTDFGELVRGLTGNPPQLIVLNLDALESKLASLRDAFAGKSYMSVGYYSHMNKGLAEEAERSRISTVMSRGEFVSKLQKILAEAFRT